MYNPQRVVTIFHATLGNVLHLGIKPVGATAINAEISFPEYLSKSAEGVKLVGSQIQPNLEKIWLLRT
jgi:iron complex transport system substrate-binding protein